MRPTGRCNGSAASSGAHGHRRRPSSEDGLIMDANLRNAYLDALGIDRWVSRGAPIESEVDSRPALPSVAAVPTLLTAPAAKLAPPDAVAVPAPRAPLPADIEWEPLRAAV